MLFRSNITLFDKVLVSNPPFFFRDIIKYPQVIFQHINSPSKFSKNYVFSPNVSIVIILPPKPFHLKKLLRSQRYLRSFKLKLFSYFSISLTDFYLSSHTFDLRALFFSLFRLLNLYYIKISPK